VRAAFAWAGGAAFVASLLTFVWVYGVALRTPAPDDAPLLQPALIDLAVFMVFALHHSVMARPGAKAWLMRWASPELERSIYVWVASLLFLGMCWLWQPLPGIAWRVESPAAWALRLAQFAGVWLTLQSAGMLDFLELAGIRQHSRRPRPVVFRTSGPYGLVRHPIYLGWFLMTLAAPTMTLSQLLMATLTCVYLVLAIPWEESSLVAGYGDRYRAYQRAVRWRLVPGVW
jgi:protein-S-isoprenylcysteine O-methyltransferase Ste14